MREWTVRLAESVAGHEGRQQETEMNRSIKHLNLLGLSKSTGTTAATGWHTITHNESCYHKCIGTHALKKMK